MVEAKRGGCELSSKVETRCIHSPLFLLTTHSATRPHRSPNHALDLNLRVRVPHHPSELDAPHSLAFKGSAHGLHSATLLQPFAWTPFGPAVRLMSLIAFGLILWLTGTLLGRGEGEKMRD